MAFLVIGTIAQEEPTDTTKFTLGDYKVVVYEDADSLKIKKSCDDKSELTHWGGIDLGVNILADVDGNTSFDGDDLWMDLKYARSLSWSINVYEEKIRLVKDYAGIITGLGITYNSYSFRDSVIINTSYQHLASDSLTMVSVDSTYGTFNAGVEYTKNKLRATYLKVPLMLEFNTSNDNSKSVHLAAGVVGGWRIGSVIKRKFERDGKKHKEKTRGDFNMTTFTLDAQVRVGYGNFTLFANYGLTPLFEDGKGPEVYPITVGLSVIPW